MSELVRLEVDEATGVGTIRLDRPKMNAINEEVTEGLAEAAREATFNDKIKAVVLWGGEKIFAAGADIKMMADRTPAEMMNRIGMMQSVFSMIEEIPKVTIAAINGYALGGGCELAMTCDFRVVADNAQMGQPEILLGVIPGAGGTQRLTRAIGKSRAMELILTGQSLTAQEACALGLVARVVPVELYLDEARGLAREIAAQPPVAVRLAKEAVLQAFESTLSGGLEFERKCFHLLFGSEDKREGIHAFLEKRPPNFTGR